MPRQDTLLACNKDLFTPEEELRKKYADSTADRVIRIRDAYNYLLSHPELKDRQIVEHIQQKDPSVARSRAYDDVRIVKTLIPNIGKNSREFNRWRYNESIWETYRMAKARKDTKTMERCLTSFAKYNDIAKEAEAEMPYDQIVVQPFVATLDVTVLGIKPIPNIYEKIDKMTKEMIREIPEIEDIDFEEADLEENKYFASNQIVSDEEDDLLQPSADDGAADSR